MCIRDSPNTVILIYEKAFSLNLTLEMITFGENVETIGDEAFSGCENLVNVNFNNAPILSLIHIFKYFCLPWRRNKKLKLQKFFINCFAL